MDGIRQFAEHIARTGFNDLPAAAVRAAKIFVLDTMGVGIAGSGGPSVPELIASAQHWGYSDEARVWTHGMRLPAPSTALCNAYQVHNSEFDCLHEAAVVHVMSAILPAAFAVAERRGGIDGRSLVTAVVLGIDVAANLGVAARAPLRFFRPGTAGGFGATAAIGKLLNFDSDRLVDAFGITLGQLCGTMQAHSEGSSLLGMQVGFNARNAVIACDMAAAGIGGPQNVLEGRFGYYALFEGEHALAPCLATLGKLWRITEVAHKPFPSGRATHGVVDAVLSLKRRHQFMAADIEAITARVPPLVHQLVGRPPTIDMAVNYARLCAPYVAARALINDAVGIEDFRPNALGDAESLALAGRIEVQIDDNPDPNAMTPVRVEIRLRSGIRHELNLDVVYGNPARPLDRAAHLGKFRRNWQAAAQPLSEQKGERLIALIDGLETLGDVRMLIDCVCPD